MKVADNLVGIRGNGTLLNGGFFLTIVRSGFINPVLSHSPCASDLHEVPGIRRTKDWLSNNEIDRKSVV